MNVERTLKRKETGIERDLCRAVAKENGAYCNRHIQKKRPDDAMTSCTANAGPHLGMVNRQARSRWNSHAPLDDPPQKVHHTHRPWLSSKPISATALPTTRPTTRNASPRCSFLARHIYTKWRQTKRNGTGRNGTLCEATARRLEAMSWDTTSEGTKPGDAMEARPLKTVR
jgi:hypothetical protein